ncbi:uncharacterized protein LOC120357158 [Solenopsis invicta]|uniref:uncharacterized protein LOC120357158 n=1 Tax=Solenopsis invicta TaxID=13686 RepID=UPI00193EB63E|nr:uncharacterized protein LOC120357158 [Solenopsis invicta]
MLKRKCDKSVKKKQKFSITKENHQQKRKLFLYSPTQVREALLAIQNGTPVSTASEAPVTTGHVGRESVLGSRVEAILVDWLLETCRMGFPITKDVLLNSVKKFVETDNLETPFTNNTPGRKWFENFMKRHPALSMKKAEYLSKTRAAVTEQYIRNWFSEVQILLKDNSDVLEDPQRVFNMDETAVYLAPKGGLVIAEKGKPTYDVFTSSDKENITTLFTVNAAGEIAPPLTVFKYERLPQACLAKAPPGWGIGKSENGWMTYIAFYEYFANVFNKYLQDENIKTPVIVFLDGHISHMSYCLSSFCKQQQIILCCLPPNATHILQPLDVAVFAPLKKHWQKFVKTWRSSHDGMDIQKFDIPGALSEIIKEKDFSKTIQAGFKCCGLYPFDPNAVKYDKCVTQTQIASDVIKSANQHSVLTSINTELLQELEKNINVNILQRFKELKSNKLNWNGETEYSALFDIWSKIYDDVYDKNITLNQTPIDVNSLEIYIEESEDILNRKSSLEQDKNKDVTESASVALEISEETNSSITTCDTSVADNSGNHQVISSQPRNGSSDVNYTDPNCGIVFNKSPENALKDILVWPQPKNTKKKRMAKIGIHVGHVGHNWCTSGQNRQTTWP